MNGTRTPNESQSYRRIAITLGTLIDENAVVDFSTARILAACIHEGSHTALERFAATGKLDRPLAMLEARRGNDFGLWRSALLGFLKQ